MIIINFSHPLSQTHLDQVHNLIGIVVDRVIDLPIQFENSSSFVPQLKQVLDKLPISSSELQTAQILINPPSLNFITALLIADLHGRMGYFPAIMRLSIVPDSIPPVYEVVEIINLQDIREKSRRKRTQ